MNKLRYWIAATFTWIFVFYNIERLHEPINVASFVYLYTAGIVTGIVVFRDLRRVSPPLLLGGLALLFFAIKFSLGYKIAGTSLPITVTELCAIGITVSLAWKIVKGIEEFEQAANAMVTTHLDDGSASFKQEQDRIYREVRRARRYDRPLTLITLSPSMYGTRESLNKLIEEIQRDAVGNYIRARISDLMTKELSDCDIVANWDDHFVLVLPETDHAAALTVIERIKSAALAELGLDIEVGTATFPDQEFTLTGMIDRARSEMNGEHGSNKGRHGNGQNGKATHPKQFVTET